MARITELRIKGDDGAFSEAYPIGAKAENVTLSFTNNDVEGYLEELQTSYNSLAESVNSAAPTPHASRSTTYGVGTKTMYGHLKIDSDFSGSNTDPTQTALSIEGAISLFKSVANFQILDDEKLYSALNTAYLNSGKSNTLTLIPDYFTISDDGTTLTAITG